MSSKIMYGKNEEPDAAEIPRLLRVVASRFKSIPSHRMLAIRRGEKEGFLLMRIEVPLERITPPRPARPGSPPTARPASRCAGGGGRLQATADALDGDRGAAVRQEARRRDRIRVFAENIRELLLASPLGAKRCWPSTRASAPAASASCSTAQGKLLHQRWSTPPPAQQPPTRPRSTQHAGREVQGRGHRHRQRHRRPRDRDLHPRARPAKSIPVVMVNESGASIYSACEVAREEFPTQDITVRGAVSIGRRLMDPLAELVKIDPKSIGVGQYQHDVDQTRAQEVARRHRGFLRQPRRRRAQHRLEAAAQPTFPA